MVPATREAVDSGTGRESAEPGGLLRFEARAMASPLALTIGGPLARRAAEEAWRVVRLEFEASEAAMSRFRATSEVTAINRAAGDGTWQSASRRLRRALVATDRARRVTGGLFDPRVLVALDGLGYRGAEIGARARSRASGDGPVVDLDRAGRLRVGTPIDLGGIGKGLALRWAADSAQRVLAEGHTAEASPDPGLLLDAGGDIVARGRGPLDGTWSIGIEDPTGGPEPLAVVALGHGAIATSSVRRTAWEVDGRRVHHLLDPATGRPADSGLLAVTVAAADPAWAEVWAKALFVAGRDRVAELARGRGLAAWWVAAERTLEMTAGARAMTRWVASEA